VKTATPSRPTRSADDPAQRGVGAHQLVAAMLTAGVRNPTPEELFEWVGRYATAQFPRPTHRLAARQRLLGPVAVYFADFGPRPRWKLIGAEVSIGRSRVDLLWKDGARLFADELKTGPAAVDLAAAQVDEQALRQARAGAKRYGANFAGVRVVLLAAPARSFWMRPDGSHQPLRS